MYVKYAIATAAILLIVAGPNTAQAYLGNWGGWTGHVDGCGFGCGHGGGSNYDNWAGGGGGTYDNGDGYYNVGYQAGISDAQSDSVYSPHPSICCHGPEWIDGFRAGYDATWTSIHQDQQQTTSQGIDNRINVVDSPNAHVSISNNQGSDQGQQGLDPNPPGPNCSGPCDGEGP
jgi:hypothetical protein